MDRSQLGVVRRRAVSRACGTALGARASGAALLAGGLLLAAPACFAQADEPRTNAFDDPFLQATRELPACPPAEGPLLTAAQVRAQSHLRAEKGTTCHLHGRCRLPNAFLYDQEIAPRVVRFIQLDPRFATSTIWVVSQRRWVYLKGCVASAAQASALVAEVRLIDDVEAVIDELMVGTRGRPPYAVERPLR